LSFRKDMEVQEEPMEMQKETLLNLCLV